MACVELLKFIANRFTQTIRISTIENIVIKDKVEQIRRLSDLSLPSLEEGTEQQIKLYLRDANMLINAINHLITLVRRAFKHKVTISQEQQYYFIFTLRRIFTTKDRDYNTVDQEFASLWRLASITENCIKHIMDPSPPPAGLEKHGDQFDIIQATPSWKTRPWNEFIVVDPNVTLCHVIDTFLSYRTELDRQGRMNERSPSPEARSTSPSPEVQEYDAPPIPFANGSSESDRDNFITTFQDGNIQQSSKKLPLQRRLDQSEQELRKGKPSNTDNEPLLGAYWMKQLNGTEPILDPLPQVIKACTRLREETTNVLGTIVKNWINVGLKSILEEDAISSSFSIKHSLDRMVGITRTVTMLNVEGIEPSMYQHIFDNLKNTPLHALKQMLPVETRDKFYNRVFLGAYKIYRDSLMLTLKSAMIMNDFDISRFEKFSKGPSFIITVTNVKVTDDDVFLAQLTEHLVYDSIVNNWIPKSKHGKSPITLPSATTSISHGHNRAYIAKAIRMISLDTETKTAKFSVPSFGMANIIKSVIQNMKDHHARTLFQGTPNVFYKENDGSVQPYAPLWTIFLIQRLIKISNMAMTNIQNIKKFYLAGAHRTLRNKRSALPVLTHEFKDRMQKLHKIRKQYEFSGQSLIQRLDHVTAPVSFIFLHQLQKEMFMIQKGMDLLDISAGSNPNKYLGRHIESIYTYDDTLMHAAHTAMATHPKYSPYYVQENDIPSLKRFESVQSKDRLHSSVQLKHELYNKVVRSNQRETPDRSQWPLTREVKGIFQSSDIEQYEQHMQEEIRKRVY